MRPSVFAFIYAISCLRQGAAAPLLSCLDSALTILKEEDFLAQASSKSASAILVESAKRFSDGRSACASLSEDLWSPDSQDFFAGVNSSLAYQIYLDKYSPTQLFWIKSPSHGPCKAIGVDGTKQNVPCHRKLPTLCTHSGAWSNYTFTDNSPQYQVTVPAGSMQVTGFRDAYGWRFDGIKYANFPGRFVHSTVRQASGPVSALAFGDVCLQNVEWEEVPQQGKEDCLYLNIATPYLPDSKRKKLKPVLFWIHGGGFIGNSGNIRNYDGVAMAARGDIVVVKINYRLGSFGYLALEGTSIKGNYGFGDMITALEWVKDNIKYFGGDREKVTIAGDSAGAASVRALISSEKAEGLFAGGILQSMPSGWRGFTGRFTNYSTIAEATEETGNSVLQLSGCGSATDKAQCIKDVSASTLNTIEAIANTPVVDNDVFHDRGLHITGQGYMAHVPILIGANRDEGGMGMPLNNLTATTFDLLKEMDEREEYFLRGERKFMSDLASHPAFPTPDGPYEGQKKAVMIGSDIAMKCESWATAYSGAKNQKFPSVYTFEFNRTYQPLWWTKPQCEPPKTAEHPLGDLSQDYFKCHSGEVDFVLGMTIYSGEAPRDEFDIPFQQLIVDYWSSFIKWGNPNPPAGYLEARNFWGTLNQVTAAGEWEQFNDTDPQLRVLQWNGGQAPIPEERCAAVDLPLDFYEQ
ncbi:hypothetical protein TWF718_000402 [Orbilia javanica]|uniref:Carboxylic ester hydrolase n=1 Tax=Orbilia javanica TaxID=47235 RepID=A0AAN8MZN1_9PEZI